MHTFKRKGAKKRKERAETGNMLLVCSDKTRRHVIDCMEDKQRESYYTLSYYST